MTSKMIDISHYKGGIISLPEFNDIIICCVINRDLNFKNNATFHLKGRAVLFILLILLSSVKSIFLFW